MDAVKFIEERKRLCGTYEMCKDCPANGNQGCMFNLYYGADADKQVIFSKLGLPRTLARRGRACFWSSIRRHASEMMVC